MVAELAQQLEQAARAGRGPATEIPDWTALARRLELELPQQCSWLRDGGSDLAYALRTWRKAPGFVLAAVFTLALGIGAATAMFSAVNAVLLRRWVPAGGASRLAYIWMPSRHFHNIPVYEFAPSYGAYNLFRHHISAFSAITLFTQQGSNVESGSGSERLGSAQVRANFFAFLGASPLAGRRFTPADMQLGAPPVVIIRQPLAHAAFGGARAALGRRLRLDGKPYRVVGVMPAQFVFPSSEESPGGARGFARNDVWLPLPLTPQQLADANVFGGGGFVLGRLGPGASWAQAQAQAAALMPRINGAQTGPAATMFGGSLDAVVQPFAQVVLGGAQRLVWLLLGAALLVSLIACVNVGNLFLVRASSRQREWSVRAALGAGRTRLLRQLLAEALLLALVGGLAGLAVAEGALRLLLHFNPGGIARLTSVSLDPRVLMFASGLTLTTVVLFGLAPAWNVARRDLAAALHSAGRGAISSPRRWRRALTVVEAALAVVLVAAAGLLVGSYRRLMSAPRGFSSSTLVASLHFDPRYSTATQQWELERQALTRLRAQPGIEAAAIASDVPLNHSTTVSSIEVEGGTSKPAAIQSHYVTLGYFRALGIALLAGRAFQSSDPGTVSEAVVSQAFAQTYFPGRSPLGRHVCNCLGPVKPGDWASIIGVVADVRHTALDQTPPPQIYLLGNSQDAANFILRSPLPPMVVEAALRKTIASLDSALAVGRLTRMQQLVAAAGAPQRFRAAVFSAFGAVALLLAAIGLYGVLAFSVRQRNAEFGVRMALGATPGAILRLVLREGVLLALLGVAIGVAAALALMRLLASELYGVTPTNAGNLAAVAAILMQVAFAASAPPAWRASRTDPLTALRQQQS
ncbi:MAG: ADOP family duplicated permease [Terriglobales bacterium]